MPPARRQPPKRGARQAKQRQLAKRKVERRQQNKGNGAMAKAARALRGAEDSGIKGLAAKIRGLLAGPPAPDFGITGPQNPQSPAWDRFYNQNPFGIGYGQQQGDFTVPRDRSSFQRVIPQFPGTLPPDTTGDGLSGRYGGPFGPVVPPPIAGDFTIPRRPRYGRDGVDIQSVGRDRGHPRRGPIY